MIKCKYEPCKNEALPYPRYQGYCSERCQDADYEHDLEGKLEEMASDYETAVLKLRKAEQERDQLKRENDILEENINLRAREIEIPLRVRVRELEEENNTLRKIVGPTCYTCEYYTKDTNHCSELDKEAENDG